MTAIYSRKRPSKGNEAPSSLLYNLGLSSLSGTSTEKTSCSKDVARSINVVATYAFLELLNAVVYRLSQPFFSDIAIPLNYEFVTAFLALHFVLDV